MVKAFLEYNPYAGETKVKFNGIPSRINSLVEKYKHKKIQDWITEIPQIFHDEMNGYDFDLEFSGTKMDFDQLNRVFFDAGVADQVEIFHKNEMDDRDQTRKEIKDLLKWLEDSQQKELFNISSFRDSFKKLLNEDYLFVTINGDDFESTFNDESKISFENITSVSDLDGVDLNNTPVIFNVTEEILTRLKPLVVSLVDREDVYENQVFFIMNIPQEEMVQRTINDLGIAKLQLVNSPSDKPIMWNVAGYFVSDDMSVAEIAASNYRSLMNGEKSGRELSAVNSWRKNSESEDNEFSALVTYLSRFIHPKFYYGKKGEYGIITDATTSISGKELGLHIGLPRATTPGLPVIEHAEFGKEVYKYSLFSKDEVLDPKDRMTLGKVFDLGQITDKVVELDNRSLNMHTFITGSTGSGKSNTVYQMLNELHQDQIPFLVVEPAKGEYRDVFGNWDDVNVFSTNPSVADLININPFKFPESIHVLEHIDGLVEIFSVCWPLYDAMPAFFKDAILRAYESVGWDLGSSTFEGEEIVYPNFEILAGQLDQLIGESDYASDIKSNYRGALITRVKSLAVGLNKYIFTDEQTPYDVLFDQNCILDISRVKSGETKALIMGLVVYILNEYRTDQKTENNSGLRHITVLEEAHNLLKNKTGGDSELVGKSVEMLTQTIAEIRTYGEGFIIVDQSPSSVDIAAIKNTNTKIVLRTPEANDREAVGRSMGLTEDQVNEIAKLPSGVAVIYQNDWVSPVLTLIDKADVTEQPYVNENPVIIKSVREARTEIIKAIMALWLPHKMIDFTELARSLNSLEINRESRKILNCMICDYRANGGHIPWNENSLDLLRNLLFDILNISQKMYEDTKKPGTPNSLERIVLSKTIGFTEEEIKIVCDFLTMEV